MPQLCCHATMATIKFSSAARCLMVPAPHVRRIAAPGLRGGCGCEGLLPHCCTLSSTMLSFCSSPPSTDSSEDDLAAPSSEDGVAKDGLGLQQLSPPDHQSSLSLSPPIGGGDPSCLALGSLTHLAYPFSLTCFLLECLNVRRFFLDDLLLLRQRRLFSLMPSIRPKACLPRDIMFTITSSCLDVR